MDRRADHHLHAAWRAWLDAARDVQAAVTEYAAEQGAGRYQVEADVKKAARHSEPHAVEG
ncbi:hypothetical protein ACFZCT_29115 [Streptomyces qaidamensis]|jgi:hypothetical protein|uniref:hypothetical protein n=1 Tax=Streptomyces qaidamensis TaxID=1783515 RepID=UPI0036E17C1A